MLKKILVLILCFCLCFAVGCSEEEQLSVDDGDKIQEDINEEVKEEDKLAVNPLTGVTNLDVDRKNDRPGAIMINNISVAQPVQTGLNKADIVYETEVEGGITRLMAVFKDISKVEKVGTNFAKPFLLYPKLLPHTAN